jgi:hypothetical protein
MIKLRLCILAVVASAALAAGCSTEVTDVSEGVDQLNSQDLAPRGAELDCPTEVDGGEGTTFDCTMKPTGGGGESAEVQLKIVESEGELAVTPADQAKFDKTLEQVGGK